MVTVCARSRVTFTPSALSITESFFLFEEQPFNLKTLYKNFLLFSNTQFWARKRYHQTGLCPTDYWTLYSTSVATDTTINKEQGSPVQRQLPFSSKGDILG